MQIRSYGRPKRLVQGSVFALGLLLGSGTALADDDGDNPYSLSSAWCDGRDRIFDWLLCQADAWFEEQWCNVVGCDW